jgi:hypothetical protein
MRKKKENRPTKPLPAPQAELQEAVNSAYAAVMFHLALALGFISGPAVNVERCEEVIAEGRALGLRPQKSAVIGIIASEVDDEDPTLGRRFAERLWEELSPRMNGRGH